MQRERLLFGPMTGPLMGTAEPTKQQNEKEKDTAQIN